MTSFQLNGETVSVSETHQHLLGALRDELGVISAKDGCAPSGQCGSCTVLVGNKARVACQTSLERTDGEDVTTLEGFDKAELQGTAISSLHTAHCNADFVSPEFWCELKPL